MNQHTFNLPDLGEGLPEAEIVSWHVKEGDQVQLDQPMLSVETAKAVVEVPSPYSGKIVRLHAKVGDTVKTGKPLVEFDLPAGSGPSPVTGHSPAAGQGMVVGHMASSDQEFVDRAIVRRSRGAAAPGRVRAAPAVRMLAKRLGIDLNTCKATGRHGLISVDDVLARANVSGGASSAPVVPGLTDADRLRGARKAMSASMSLSRDQIAMCTIFDDADIQSWHGRADITVRVIRAIAAGVRSEPGLNALFDPSGPSRKIMAQLHLAIAVDTADGLIVPVLRDVASQTPEQLRAALNDLKERTHNRTVAPDQMRDYTFTLSNFGTMAGRYATPLVVPPTVAILGSGRLQRDVVAGETGPEIHTRLPLSLTFDHRCITGGEACRFLGAVIADLQSPG
ncbi:pyruvate dehydrogenase E2 component (dihydrolipoamide acetyltransferase) [Povalibacter uvarum]|uniref:Dihydrolipoamide acetyltransferase component of pyruvate dehydrogenase complex n=1 Tax=Povalibacter uvarum TaxID=732238 RepID=A0A841HW61_9GAMM|nr:dihydrolipoamide acetyltransferase family protein [Povalibacter uvarum]MBB6096025.1 pyruvate dehydrogenase E2 component (dihydrolipoamide acetyltransferase) [Povalibacter uvarum]